MGKSKIKTAVIELNAEFKKALELMESEKYHLRGMAVTDPDWIDSSRQQVTGTDDGPVQHVVTVRHVQVPPIQTIEQAPQRVTVEFTEARAPCAEGGECP